MAARAEQSGGLEITDLRHFHAPDLAPLLDEESRNWAERLRWDFTASRDIVRRYLDQRALSGFALLDGSALVGYSYYVQEDHKVLIGDLFVSQPYRTRETEHALLRQVVAAARSLPGVRRVEAQLMMLEAGAIGSLFAPSELAAFERNFMLLDGIRYLGRENFGRRPGADLMFERWADSHAEAASQLIARCYHGHLDSQINDQYESVAGARRFLYNIMHYPGCGAFHAPAGVAVFERSSGEFCGLSLASVVFPGVGHLTQVCVAQPQRGQGIGSELLWRSSQALAGAGCDAISLTVTAGNAGAVRLYERIGFRTVRRFYAYVWRGLR